MGWNINTVGDRVRAAIKQLERLEVKKARTLGDLDSTGINEARLIDGVHGYVDLLNAAKLLETDNSEGERAQKRYLRFLHLFQRVAKVALASAGADKVDFQNQRLHFVVASPTDDECARCVKAVAVAYLLLDVLGTVHDDDVLLCNPVLSIGLETGMALAVRNGTKSDREPLFLGEPANRAAKLLGEQGVFVGPRMAGILGVHAGELGTDKLKKLLDEAALGVTAEKLRDSWAKEKRSHPMAEFSFSAPRFPLSNLNLDDLAPGNSRRTEMVSIFADVDGFSAFVAKCIEEDRAEDAARALHVIRKELRDTLNDLEGRKIRYHGDCIQGVIGCGTGTKVDKELSAARAVLCAVAMLDAFKVIQQELGTTAELGLAVGMEAGPTAITRLGIRGTMDRCATGRAVLAAERKQRDCNAEQIGLGENLWEWAPSSIQALFDKTHCSAALSYKRVFAELRVDGIEKGDDPGDRNSGAVLRRAHLGT